MRVVVDTNVLVGAPLTPHGPNSVIVGLCLARMLSPLVDERIMDEYEEVLRRSGFAFAPAQVNSILERWRRIAVSTVSAPIPGGTKGLPDQDDAAFLEIAFCGKAEALITGNIRHFPERARNGIVVLRPIDFIQQFLEARKPKRS